MTLKWMQKLRGRDWLHHHPLLSLRGLPGVVATSGISVRLWRAYAQAWLICLLFPIISLVQTPLPLARLLLALVGLVIFVIGYTWFMWPHPLNYEAHRQLGFRTSLPVLMGLTAMVLALSLVYGRTFLWLFVGVSAMAGIVLPAGSAFLAIVTLTLLTLGASVGVGGGVTKTDWFHVVPLVLLVRGLGVDMIGVARLSDALRELYTARGELAHQAVIEERLRLARDLHDLLGHTLSMITLKSELASRLIETDSTRAAQEIREVERAARQALREVREALSDYRRQTLQGELDGARQILEAAGIGFRVEQTAGALPPHLDAVLAWTVREGVTNVIRHSRARRCLIRITGEDGTVSAEVINDGYRTQEQVGTVTIVGSGLSGLAERVAKQGGRMEVGSLLTESGPSFRLHVELPLPKILEPREASRL